MQIRSEQIDELNAKSETKFVDRLVALVAEGEASEEDVSITRETCKKLMKRAAACQFVTEFEVAAFVACGFAFGADFDSREDLVFRKILQEPDTSPRLKAAQMVRVLDEAEDDASPVVY